jgi:DTW domain-containing protein YfiP
VELVHDEPNEYIESYTHDSTWEEAYRRFEGGKVLDILVAVCFRQRWISRCKLRSKEWDDISCGSRKSQTYKRLKKRSMASVTPQEIMTQMQTEVNSIFFHRRLGIRARLPILSR